MKKNDRERRITRRNDATEIRNAHKPRTDTESRANGSTSRTQMAVRAVTRRRAREPRLERCTTRRSSLSLTVYDVRGVIPTDYGPRHTIRIYDYSAGQQPFLSAEAAQLRPFRRLCCRQ